MTGTQRQRDVASFQFGHSWGPLFLLLCLATPKVVLPGGVPFRLDDLIAFAVAGCGIVVSIALKHGDPPDVVEWVLVLTAAYVLVDAILGSPVGGTVGVKEYLDALRPLKFAAVYRVVRSTRRPVSDTRRTAAVAAFGMIGMVALAAMQQFLLNPGSTGLLATVSLLYKEAEDQSRSYLGYRAFATFSTPTDFAYVATGTLLGAISARGFPWRPVTIALAAFGIVLSGTRTFLFAGPAILLLTSLLSGGSWGSRARNLITGIFVVSLATWAGVNLLSTDAREAIRGTFENLITGDFEANDSLRLRLLNFALADLTWTSAPWRGVVTRDFMRPEDIGGVDSEYLLTFHRYGLLGLALLLAASWSLVATAARHRFVQPSLSRWLTLLATVGLLYGVTQGAMINTRIGVIPYIVAGLLVACATSPQPVKTDT